MNARELQTALVDDLKKLFTGKLYKTPAGENAGISVFEQHLPKRLDDESEDPFPYIIVRLDSGGIDTQTDPHKVAVLLLVGIFDDSVKNEGHKAVMEIIEKIQNHYEAEPVLAGQFRRGDPFNWVLQDEESYPYFFGAANLTWELPATRTKWSDLV